MRSFVLLGREARRRWVCLLVGFALCGCQPKSGDVEISSTPVATPIVVGETPDPSPTNTPTKVVDTLAERELILERVGAIVDASRKDFPGNSAVYFIDIESDLSLDYEGEKRFESASLMKLIVIAELFRLIQLGELELDKQLVLEKDQIVGGSGDLKQLEPGMTFPIKVLAEKMIAQSDNTATQMLTDFLTKESLNKSIKNLGLTGTTINRDIYDFAAIDRGHDNYITAKDAAMLMEQLAREQLPGSEQIHLILEGQQRNDMIGSGIPPTVKVAHKTGELNGILHDVGIVYAPRGSYVLAMLSDGVLDKEKAIESFRKLSQDILEIYNPPKEEELAEPSPSSTQEP